MKTVSHKIENNNKDIENIYGNLKSTMKKIKILLKGLTVDMDCHKKESAI